MNNTLLELKQSVSLETPRQLRHALQAVIEDHIPTIICQRILLCLSEAVTNLLLHAQPTAKQISISFKRENEGWDLNIYDHCQAWDPTAHFDDSLLTEFSTFERGRGIALLHTQSDNINYQSNCDNQGKVTNQLKLFWAFPKTQPKQTILLVEDNNNLRLLYQAYLAHSFTVLTAINGYQALEKLNEHKIDLVLSDIKMPHMNGLSLRKKINQQSGRTLIPFIFLTGEDNEVIQEQATELGIDDYLIKPINKIQLIKIIHRVLGRSKQVYQQLTERIDKQISDSLKPEIPDRCHGWRLQVATRDTGRGGGDLLLHNNFENVTQLLLCDIMGHDASAKFFSHAYGGYMHGLMQSMTQDQGPADILEQLSTCAMVDNILSRVTLTCCSIQLALSGKITIASAGHPEPLLITAQKIAPIAISGVLPGLIKNSHYESCSLSLQQGQRMAFFSDGLFESADNNEARQQLQQQITTALLTTLNLPIEQALQQVMMLFDKITASQPNDDVLLLLIETI